MAHRWIKSETFWQGVAIQTLGTLVAAVIWLWSQSLSESATRPLVRYFVIYGLIAITVYIVRSREGYSKRITIARKSPIEIQSLQASSALGRTTVHGSHYPWQSLLRGTEPFFSLLLFSPF